MSFKGIQGKEERERVMKLQRAIFFRESKPAHELTVHELVMGYPEILIS
jgi:hypothetical protein